MFPPMSPRDQRTPAYKIVTHKPPTPSCSQLRAEGHDHWSSVAKLTEVSSNARNEVDETHPQPPDCSLDGAPKLLLHVQDEENVDQP